MPRVCTKIMAPGPLWLLLWWGKVQATPNQTYFRVFGFSTEQLCNSATIVVAKLVGSQQGVLQGGSSTTSTSAVRGPRLCQTWVSAPMRAI